jgi:Ni/Co efflux regulator RcnB
MKRIAAGIACAMLLSATPALADKPSWAGEGKPDKHGHKHEQRDKRKDGREEHRRSEVYFGDRHRLVIRDYYAGEFRSGHCPPGLAKKGNGCLPPGQAKKWRIGRPLPPDVMYYDLPPVIVTSLGPPPPGHRYVRVAGDILLIALGSALVIDAIQDLSGR